MPTAIAQFVLAHPCPVLQTHDAGAAHGLSNEESAAQTRDRILYRPDAYESVRAFQQSDAFPQFRQECEEDMDDIAAFAMSIGPQLGTDVAADLALKLNRLKDSLFASQPASVSHDFSAHLGQLYSDAKPGLERIRAGLYDQRIPLETRIAKLRNWAPTLGVCSGGVMNGIAKMAMDLELARDGSLVGAFRSAFHAALQTVLLEALPEHMRDQSTHDVQGALNVLAPEFGFPHVDDPFARADLDPRYQAIVDRLKTPEGIADVAAIALDDLADECLAKLMERLPKTNKLNGNQPVDHERIPASFVMKEITPLLQVDVDKTADAIAAYGSLRPTELAAAFGPLQAGDFLRENDDVDGTYALNRDTSILQSSLARNIADCVAAHIAELHDASAKDNAKNNAILAALTPRPVTSWQEPLSNDVTATATLYAIGKARWVRTGSQSIPTPIELSHLERLQGNDISDQDYLAAANCVMAGMNIDDLRSCKFPGLESRLGTLSVPDACKLNGLMRCLHARPHDYQRVLTHAAGASIATRLAWAIEFDLRGPAIQALHLDDGSAHRLRTPEGDALMLRAVLRGNTQAVSTLLQWGVDPTNARSEIHRLRFDQQPGFATLTPEQRSAISLLGSRLHVQERLFDRISNDDPEGIVAALNAGADPNEADALGRLPLQFAIAKSRPGCARVLIERGADINAANRDDRNATPLAHAIRFGDTATMELLLNHGANTIIDGSGKRHLWSLIEKASPAKQGTMATMLYAAHPWRSDRQEILEAILDRAIRSGANDHGVVGPIVVAALEGDDLTDDLLAKHANNPTLLQLAAALPDGEAARTLVDRLWAVRPFSFGAARMAASAAILAGRADMTLLLTDRLAGDDKAGLLTHSLAFAIEQNAGPDITLPILTALRQHARPEVLLRVLATHGKRLPATVMQQITDDLSAKRGSLPNDLLPSSLRSLLEAGCEAPARLLFDTIIERSRGATSEVYAFDTRVAQAMYPLARPPVTGYVGFGIDLIVSAARAGKPDWAHSLAEKIGTVTTIDADSLEVLLNSAPDVMATLVKTGLNTVRVGKYVFGNEPLDHYAAKNGSASMLKACLPSLASTGDAQQVGSAMARAKTLLGIATRAGKYANVDALLELALPPNLTEAEKAMRAAELFAPYRKGDGRTVLTELLDDPLKKDAADRTRIVTRFLDYPAARSELRFAIGRALYMAASIEPRDAAVRTAFADRCKALDLRMDDKSRGLALYLAGKDRNWAAVKALLDAGARPRNKAERAWLMESVIRAGSMAWQPTSSVAAQEAGDALVQMLHGQWRKRSAIARFFASLFYGRAAWLNFRLPESNRTPLEYAKEVANKPMIDRITDLTAKGTAPTYAVAPSSP